MLNTLHLANAPPAATRSTGTSRATPPWQVDPAVSRIVWHRDDGVCCYCGFRSLRYQEVVVTGGNARDVDTMATACQFCHQCLHLPQVATMHSGVLIWLPELTQADLHHVMRSIYLARLTQKHGPRARVALDALMKRRQEVRDRFGSDDPRTLSERLAAAADRRDCVLPPELEAGIRLLPLDRRIVTEEDLEYNKFPQVLAFWRSRNGPYAHGPDLAPISVLDRALAGESAAPVGAPKQAPDPAPTCAALAAKLLRDAATFFDKVGESNDPLREQMAENAGVFRHIADLLERDPDQVLGTDSPTPADRRVSTMAARLLEDAAGFFESVGAQAPSLQEQMTDNADVFRQLASRVRDDPRGLLAERD